MRIAYFCFIVAAVAALAGMVLGIVMGLSEDFTLSPAHAHLNLLGWATMALYGLYHRGIERSEIRLAWFQVGFGATGIAVMTSGLGFFLTTGNEALVPIAAAGSFLSLLSMALFLAILVRDARGHADHPGGRINRRRPELDRGLVTSPVRSTRRHVAGLFEFPEILPDDESWIG